jgi:hypothetical protein
MAQKYVCGFYSLQFDDPTHLADTAQLAVIVAVVFTDKSTKEKILTVLPLKDKTRGQDIYHSFRDNASDINLPLQNLC